MEEKYICFNDVHNKNATYSSWISIDFDNLFYHSFCILKWSSIFIILFHNKI